MMIETERVAVRAFCEEDVHDLWEILGDEQTMKYVEPPYDFEKTSAFLKSFCLERRGALAVVHKGSGKVIGYILFSPLESGVYEMGWIFNKNYWRKGYAYESCRALIDYAFSFLGADKIFAETADDKKSVPLMKKLGMREKEIRKNSSEPIRGKRRDLYVYELSKTFLTRPEV